MTGFGAGERESKGVLYRTELRALNSKGLDINVKLSSNLKSFEPVLRKYLGTLSRGKIDLIVSEERNQGVLTQTSLNLPLMHAYCAQLKAFAEQEGLRQDDMLRSVLALPDVVIDHSEGADAEAIQSALEEAIQDAIAALNEFRRQEGTALESDVRQRIDFLRQHLTEMEPWESERTERIREKLSKELKLLAQEVQADPGRLEMEMIFYIEKLDISEEKVRLQAHCDYFVSVLEEPDFHEKGKKLGFIAQKMGREVNTIGSKANHSGIQKIVVLMKDEIEKIKEQVNNIL